MSKNILFFILVLVLFSCEEDDETSGNGGDEIQISATINGQTFERDNAAVSILQDVLIINATIAEPFQNIELRVENIAEGTFNFGQNVNQFVPRAIYRNEESTFITDRNGGTGQLTITNLDIDNLLLSGTFSYTALSEDGTTTIMVSNGSFEDLEIDNFAPEALESDNNLATTIDGTSHRSDIVIATESGFPDDFIVIESLNNFTGQQVSIFFQEDLLPGTYTFSPDANALVQGAYTFFASPNDIAPTSLEAISGTLVITVYNTDTRNIEGTFDFIAADTTGDSSLSIPVSSGQFNVIVSNN